MQLPQMNQQLTIHGRQTVSERTSNFWKLTFHKVVQDVLSVMCGWYKLL